MWGYCVWSSRSPPSSIDVLPWTEHCDGSIWMHYNPTEVIAPVLFFFFCSNEMDRIFCFLSPINGNYLSASANKMNL